MAKVILEPIGDPLDTIIALLDTPELRRDALRALVEFDDPAQFDKARLQVDVLRTQKEQADQQLRLVETGPRPERITAQRAVVSQAEAPNTASAIDRSSGVRLIGAPSAWARA